MQILVIGSGGREHALAWKFAQDPAVTQVWVAPGNAGTATEAKCSNAPIDVMDFAALAALAKRERIDLTVVGPELPLVGGLVDYFAERGLPCFGPSQRAAQLEGSKAFSKDFLARNRIPTATYASFTRVDQALTYLSQVGAPIVVKADGLAAGKGVVVAMTLAEAEAAVRDMLAGNSFGKAGARVVIEEFLEGEEASFIVMADGKNALAMATSQDHKRAFDGDLGPNTGGMGAYSPAPVVTDAVYKRIMSEVIEPTLAGLAREAMPYTGFLYAGLMIDGKGRPKVIEYNCRFGDPETQPIMLRMQSQLAPLCLAALKGQLDRCHIKWDPRPAVGVVLAAKGYPGPHSKGDPIGGLAATSAELGKIFHAGTALRGDQVVSNGGRVLCATALGDTIGAATRSAYQLAASVTWPGGFYRRDIAHRALARES